MSPTDDPSVSPHVPSASVVPVRSPMVTSDALATGLLLASMTVPITVVKGSGMTFNVAVCVVVLLTLSEAVAVKTICVTPPGTTISVANGG